MTTEEKHLSLIKKVVKKFPKNYRDDLYQECYIKLQLLDTENEALIYTSLQNHCKNYLKRQDKYSLTLDDYITNEDDCEIERYTDLIEDNNNSPLIDIIENKDITNQYLKSLSPIDRLIITAKYMFGCTDQEIINMYGEIIGVKSRSTLKTRIKKILNR